MIEPEEELTHGVDNNTIPEALVSETEDIMSENVLEDSQETAKVEIETPEIVAEATVTDEIQEIEEIDEEHHMPVFDADLSEYSKKDYVDLAGKMLDSMSARSLSLSDVKNIDSVMKLTRQAFDDINAKEKTEAKAEYKSKNGSDEGFDYKNDNFSVRFEGILIQIREKRQTFYQKLEREKEDYFEVKTRLLQTLREIVEKEEKGESKNNWDAFKQLQTDWKNAGNVNSVHNGTLWSGYNALVDRYFDIRSIQNELKDLDRKKNIINKEGVVIKIEAIADTLKETPLTNATLKRANDLLQEYKLIGPGIREEQDLLWNRLKLAFDFIYEKKRDLVKENGVLLEDTYNAKAMLFDKIKAYLEFSSDSINEWNAKSKEVMEVQEQWNAIKGPLPKDKGKDISKDFWNALKLFFKNKSDFFGKLEAKREANFKAKEELCIKAEEIVAKADLAAANTNAIIDLQKQWKTIGQVPEKFKDSLYNRFKAACDQYFNLKRDENKAIDAEFDNNLKAKNGVCDEIEKAIAAGNVDFNKLNEFKKSFSAIGMVPKKDMQTIQNRFIKVVNSFVKSSTGIDSREKDKMMLQNEAEVVNRGGGSSKNLDKQEGDIKRRIKSLEEEITLTKNNLEFFGFSKNAEKLKEEYLKKVEKSEKELKDLKDKLKVIVSA